VKLFSVVGTRPNFMKLAPVARAFRARGHVEHMVVHTGQHYDDDMSGIFFSDLGLSSPEFRLGIGKDSASAQTAAVLERLTPLLVSEAPDAVIVYGDVTSTMAAALAASQLHIPVVHVEAGLRSRDRSMPEEINRIITDHVAELLLAPSIDAVENLKSEGIPETAIRFVGNVMIDTLVDALPQARARQSAERQGLKPGEYIVATLHRPSNVDDPRRLTDLLSALVKLAEDRDVVFPVHPRTRHRFAALGVDMPSAKRFHIVDPLGYMEMLSLVDTAALVITDSGGLQEETSFLGVPCITVRPNTERPITIAQGTNRLVRGDRGAILEAAYNALALRPEGPPTIDRWDGQAGERIAEAIAAFVGMAPVTLTPAPPSPSGRLEVPAVRMPSTEGAREADAPPASASPPVSSIGVNRLRARKKRS
jgi:UDP-N-acetylglucosamine 2-epimerase (non-hydrolysing)